MCCKSACSLPTPRTSGDRWRWQTFRWLRKRPHRFPFRLSAQVRRSLCLRAASPSATRVRRGVSIRLRRSAATVSWVSATSRRIVDRLRCGNTFSGYPYFLCPGGVCGFAIVPLANQVWNPVTLFTQDNNGVLVSLPSIPEGGQATVSGSLIFGIGTQTNNALGSAQVYAADAFGNIQPPIRQPMASLPGLFRHGLDGLLLPGRNYPGPDGDHRVCGLPVGTVQARPSVSRSPTQEQMAPRGRSRSALATPIHCSVLWRTRLSTTWGAIAGLASRRTTPTLGCHSSLAGTCSLGSWHDCAERRLGALRILRVLALGYGGRGGFGRHLATRLAGSPLRQQTDSLPKSGRQELCENLLAGPGCPAHVREGSARCAVFAACTRTRNRPLPLLDYNGAARIWSADSCLMESLCDAKQSCW